MSLLEIVLQALIPVGLQWLETELAKLTPQQASNVGTAIQAASAHAQTLVAKTATKK